MGCSFDRNRTSSGDKWAREWLVFSRESGTESQNEGCWTSHSTSVEEYKLQMESPWRISFIVATRVLAES
jgi:hypothetical protein